MPVLFLKHMISAKMPVSLCSPYTTKPNIPRKKIVIPNSQLVYKIQNQHQSTINKVKSINRTRNRVQIHSLTQTRNQNDPPPKKKSKRISIQSKMKIVGDKKKTVRLGSDHTPECHWIIITIAITINITVVKN